MRPLPIPTEVVAQMNQGEGDKSRFQKITMHPPEGRDDVQPIEVIVDTVLGIDANREIMRTPRQFIARIAVMQKDLEALHKHGFFYVSLFGDHMQPFAVWVDDGQEDTDDGDLIAVEGLRVFMLRSDGETFGYVQPIPPHLKDDHAAFFALLARVVDEVAKEAGTHVGGWSVDQVTGWLPKIEQEEGANADG